MAVVHHVLQWHHYEESGDAAAELRSDGYLLLVLWAFAVAGLLGLLALARSGAALPARELAGGALLGVGAFNAFDIVVDHWLLGRHRLIQGVDSWAPDLAWLAGSLLALAAGAALLRRPREAAGPGPARV